MSRRPLFVLGTAIFSVLAAGSIQLAQRQAVSPSPSATKPSATKPVPVAVKRPAIPLASNANLMPVDARNALVNQYCVKCHNDKLKSGDMSLAQMDFAHVD